MNKVDKESKILEQFYCEYFRSPRKKEFEALGGCIDDVINVYGTYTKFLEHYGYPRVSKGETYKVINERSGKVVFTGTVHDIAEEFDVFITTVHKAYRNNKKFIKKQYVLKQKPFKLKGT